MANLKKKLPELPQITDVTDSDLMHVNQNGIDYKATADKFKSTVVNNLTTSSIGSSLDASQGTELLRLINFNKNASRLLFKYDSNWDITTNGNDLDIIIPAGDIQLIDKISYSVNTDSGTIIDGGGLVLTYTVLSNSFTYSFVSDLSTITEGDDENVFIIAKNISGNLYTSNASLNVFIPRSIIDFYPSAGVLIQPDLTDNLDGSITVGTGTYALNSTTRNDENDISAYEISGDDFILTDNVPNYVVANYNSGTPIIQVVTDVNVIDESLIIPIFTIPRTGTTLHTIDWDQIGILLANKLHASIVKTQRFRLQSGLALSEYGTRNINLTAGIVWVGANEVSLLEINSDVDNIRFYKHVAGVWTYSAVTAYNNTQYDDGTDLQNLSNNQYGAIFIYRGVELNKHLYMILGSDSYTQSAAEEAQPPADIPTQITSHAILVGKIIIEKNAATATLIQSAFSVIFNKSTSTSHDSLSDINLANTGVTYGHVDDQAQEFYGEKTFNSSPIVDSETASTIASFDATKNIKSLATATYPDLTELSYVKGATSSLQDQIDTIGGAAGDMLKSTYDPTAVAADAFDMDNMDEGATTKILTDTERSEIATNTAKVGVTTEISSIVEDTTPQLGGDLDANSKRIVEAQGADVASANNLVLGGDGNIFAITGTTQINLISSLNWGTGALITLYFDAILTVKHGQTTSGNDKRINLSGDTDFTSAAGDILTLRLIDSVWEEVSRNAVGAGGGHIYKENGSATIVEGTRNIVNNGTKQVLVNEVGVETEEHQFFEVALDVDPTGKADGDVWGYNQATGKTEPVSTTPQNFYLNNVEANLTADAQLSIILTAGYKIDTIILKETAGNAVTGGIDIGSTTSGNDIVSAEAVSASSENDATIIKPFFSTTTDTDLYISAATAWNNADITVYITLKKVI